MGVMVGDHTILSSDRMPRKTRVQTGLVWTLPSMQQPLSPRARALDRSVLIAPQVTTPQGTAPCVHGVGHLPHRAGPKAGPSSRPFVRGMVRDRGHCHPPFPYASVGTRATATLQHVATAIRALRARAPTKPTYARLLPQGPSTSVAAQKLRRAQPARALNGGYTISTLPPPCLFWLLFSFVVPLVLMLSIVHPLPHIAVPCIIRLPCSSLCPEPLWEFLPSSCGACQ